MATFSIQHITAFDRTKLKPVRTVVRRAVVGAEEETDTLLAWAMFLDDVAGDVNDAHEDPTNSAGAVVTSTVRLDASAVEAHGAIGAGRGWAAPLKVTHIDLDARPGYITRKAHEYLDDAPVLAEKVRLLAELIQRSERCLAYTGAGISTSTGISDYATRSRGVASSGRPQLVSPLDAQPSLAHRVLTSMYKCGYLKYWVQQNHDGLPQKAGYPQHALNEIHGAWFDPSNPVVPMKGQLRDDLFRSMLEWEDITDLCIAVGTSLAGMNADRVASTVAAKACTGRGGALGTVIIGLQQTRLDAESSLRIFAKIDDVFDLLARELLLDPNSALPNAAEVRSDVVCVPYASSGLKTSALHELDLRLGSRVRITSGPNKGRVCEVKGKRNGNYLLHSCGHGVGLPVHEYVLGSWIVTEAEKGLLDWCPVTSMCDEGSAPQGQRKVKTCAHSLSVHRPGQTELAGLTGADMSVGTSGRAQHVFLRDCEGCSFTIARAVKVTIERCASCTVRVMGPLLSGTAEVIRCRGVVVEARVGPTNRYDRPEQ
jgi:NAD-dependent SIR2 family protein deacetylase